MNRHHHEFATYTGAALPHPPPGHGFCESCCHPAAKCCCHRECRKEARELLVQPTLARAEIEKDPARAAVFARSALFRPQAQTAAGTEVQRLQEVSAPTVGIGQAFIGGGCCVHLSVEYVPQTPAAKSIVAVLVDDSEGTVLAWGQVEQAGAGYHIKECIVTTKPGADLTVMVVNMTARVRWCEIFSC